MIDNIIGIDVFVNDMGGMHLPEDVGKVDGQFQKGTECELAGEVQRSKGGAAKIFQDQKWAWLIGFKGIGLYHARERQALEELIFMLIQFDALSSRVIELEHFDHDGPLIALSTPSVYESVSAFIYLFGDVIISDRP